LLHEKFIKLTTIYLLTCTSSCLIIYFKKPLEFFVCNRLFQISLLVYLTLSRTKKCLQMKKNENFVSKTSKKAFLFLFIIACIYCTKTSATNTCLIHLDLSGIRCQILKNAIDLDITYLKPYIIFWHTLFFTLLAIVLVLLFYNYKKKKKLNDKMVQYIRAVYDLKKNLDLIKKPLEEISKDDNINEAQKANYMWPFGVHPMFRASSTS